MRNLSLIASVAFAACSTMPEQAAEVTVWVAWPSEAPSSMTVIAYGCALQELTRKTVTGVDSVRFSCQETVYAAIAFPYSESEWRSLRLRSTGSLVSASVIYGEGDGSVTQFSAGGASVERGECHISALALLHPREVCLRIDEPSRIASIEGALLNVPAGVLLRGGETLADRASVPLRDWRFSGTEARSTCTLFDSGCVGTVSLRILLKDGQTVFRTRFPSGPPGMFPVPEISLPETSGGGSFQAEVGDWTQADTITINV